MLFSSKKKHSRNTSSSQDGPSVAEALKQISLNDEPTSKGWFQSTRQSFTTGSCMTCGSTVRWPSNLTVFRCTICVTVNDLQPLGPRAPNGFQSQRTEGHLREGSTEIRNIPSTIDSISLQRTKATINGCLRSYLRYSFRLPRSRSSDRASGSEGREAISTHQQPGGHAAGTHARNRTSPDASLMIHPDFSSRNPRNHADLGTPSPPRQPGGRDRGLPGIGGPAMTTGPDIPDADVKRIFKPLEDYILNCFSSADNLNRSFRRHSPRPLELSSNPDRDTSIHFDRVEVCNWYRTIGNSGQSWCDVFAELRSAGQIRDPSPRELDQVEARILAAQEHVQRVLLKATETLLKRPGRPVTKSENVRFLLILLANPFLRGHVKTYTGRCLDTPRRPGPPPRLRSGSGNGPASGQHSGIIKRLLGIMSNSPDECHRHLVQFFSQDSCFTQYKDLVAGFLAYRLRRQRTKAQEDLKNDITGGLVPTMRVDASAATLHAAIGSSRGTSSKSAKSQPPAPVYREDWQIKAAARVLALLYTANKSRCPSGLDPNAITLPGSEYSKSIVRDYALARHQFLPISDFYTVLLDDSDIIADFEDWELHKGKRFSFCQYPFLLSIWAKIQILEYDARRQMQSKARDAFFDSIMTHRNVEQHLTLNVRRECLVEDSLKAVGEVVGSAGDEIKKGLRIIFRGEEGIDGGGLRKEWFLLLVREVFNPDHGMFLYDDESHFCYFNPASLETSDQFFLVGVVLGLATYNSTILDVAFPSFAFRKLLANIPRNTPSPSTSTLPPRPSSKLTLADLAEYRPSLARGLRQLLDYPDNDVETTFCLNFTITTDRLGKIETIPLCPGGASRPVTNDNRKEYVDLYIHYLLDTSVSRQFEPFRRGFFAVCGGSNALSLFAPEEIELLVRGSDEALDVASLRGAASYDGFRKSSKAETDEPTVQWFWETFEEASPADQRKLLMFITGSDRIPATGPAALSVRLVCLGDDEGRYPTARTCFNGLYMARFKTKARLERMLWGAVHESEGFGLK